MGHDLPKSGEDTEEGQTPPACETLLKGYLTSSGRGSAVELCLATELNQSEVSSWLSGRRGIPSHKLLQAVSWLIATGRISVTFNL